MKFRQVYVKILIVLFLRNSCFSQELPGSEKYSLSAEGGYASFLMHRKAIMHMGPLHTGLWQLNIYKESDNRKYWQQAYDFPRTGISLLFTPLGNNYYTGFSAAVLGSVCFPQIQKKKFLSYFRLACGPGYIQKIYHIQSNYKNLVNSTHLNGCIQISEIAECTLYRNLHLQLIIGMTHFSNGAYRLPNLGINLVSGGAGFNYLFGKKDNVATELPVLSDTTKVFSMRVMAGAGIKEVYPTGGKTFYAYTASYSFIFHRSKYNMLLNADVFYDNSLRNYLINDNNIANDNTILLQTGISAGIELILGRLLIPFQSGVYVLNAPKISPFLYTRIGLKYRITSRFLCGITLKTHYAKADYMEWGIGYEW